MSIPSEQPAVAIADCALRLGEHAGEAVVFRLERFVLARGERLALTGPSGCGKSTLLNLISGLLRPDAGEIVALGRRLNDLSGWRLDRFRGESLGFVFQGLNLLDGFSAIENVMVGMRFGRTIPPRQRHARAEELLRRVGLGRRLHQKPARLSAGERQRVAIARALANGPALLLADEPTGSLDPRTADEVFALIQELCAETGCSLLFVTHDMELAGRLPGRFDCRALIVHEPANEAAA